MLIFRNYRVLRTSKKKWSLQLSVWIVISFKFVKFYTYIFMDVFSLDRKTCCVMGHFKSVLKWKPFNKFMNTFRKPYRTEHTAGVALSSSPILETNRKRKQQWGQGTRGGSDSSEKWTRYSRDAVSVSEGFPSSVLLPQEANARPPAAGQHRHQPGLQVGEIYTNTTVYFSIVSSSESVCFGSQDRV